MIDITGDVFMALMYSQLLHGKRSIRCVSRARSAFGTFGLCSREQDCAHENANVVPPCFTCLFRARSYSRLPFEFSRIRFIFSPSYSCYSRPMKQRLISQQRSNPSNSMPQVQLLQLRLSDVYKKLPGVHTSFEPEASFVDAFLHFQKEFG